jgi:phage repressor protein C with HTH and peptisase S24 domain
MAADAARALGVRPEVYHTHENGLRGLSRSAERYARFFRVSLDWLIAGKGEMKPKRALAAVKMMGTVGAGQTAGAIDGHSPDDGSLTVDLPDPSDTFALLIVGDSASPRYDDGDYLLVDRNVYPPEQMTGRYCVIDLADGRRVVKRLRKERGTMLLVSENSTFDVEISPKIIACYRIRGVISR